MSLLDSCYREFGIGLVQQSQIVKFLKVERYLLLR